MKISTLNIDIETYCRLKLKTAGVYRYASDPSFEILLFGYSADGGPVRVVDLVSGEKIPDDILDALVSGGCVLSAFNANFERVCLSEYLRRNYPERFHGYSVPEDPAGNYLDPSAWRCSMVWSAYLGLPLSLADVGAVLGLEEQKLKEGHDLIKYFCEPCKPTKKNGGRTRNLPSDDPEKWNLFKAYNQRDVEVEMNIQKRLSRFPVPSQVWEEYFIDQEVNDRGILLSPQMVENAISFDVRVRDELKAAMQRITELDNPNSVQQMKQWLAEHDMVTESLDKKAVRELLKSAPTPDVAEALQLRQQLAKSSVKKYQAMQNTVCADSRVRGMYFFYGANRSGRWAGRLIQLQNLPQNHLSDLAEARSLVLAGDYEMMKLLYDDIPDTLSQLIRTAFIPRPGYKFIVSDFSAIEARVLSWLADETWRTEVFVNNGDIYCASASAMFGVPVAKGGPNAGLRQKGKIAELALGYGGGVGALKSMGALEMGLSEEELQPLVDSWRAANPHIVKFWWAVDRAVKTAVKEHIRTTVKGIRFECRSGMLFVTLPSGRALSYVKPKIGENRYGGESVTYEGIGTTKKWERVKSYGPKFVENIVQAISRDILCYAMQTLRNCFIVGHVHDELIIECAPDVSLQSICDQMGQTPPWAKGLVLRADGYECEFYRKG